MGFIDSILNSPGITGKLSSGKYSNLGKNKNKQETQATRHNAAAPRRACVECGCMEFDEAGSCNSCGLKHGDKETQAKGRIKHRHPLYNHGSRIVVITEANGTTVVTEFDRDNDL